MYVVLNVRFNVVHDFVGILIEIIVGLERIRVNLRTGSNILRICLGTSCLRRVRTWAV